MPPLDWSPVVFNSHVSFTITNVAEPFQDEKPGTWKALVIDQRLFSRFVILKNS
jgi:hypothetical protein